MKPTSRADALQMPKRALTAPALFAAMFLALAVVSGASLSAAGSGVLHKVSQALDLGHSATIEAEQRRQTAVIAALAQSVEAVSAKVGTLTTRLKVAEHNDVTVGDRFALVDTDIAALVAEVRAMRTARGEITSGVPWREPVERLDAAVTDARTDAAAARADASAARTDVAGLRSSLDAHEQTYRQDIGTITRRLDRIEQMVSRDLTGSIRPQVRKKQVRRKPRAALAARRKGGAAAVTVWGEVTGSETIFAPNRVPAR